MNRRLTKSWSDATKQERLATVIMLFAIALVGTGFRLMGPSLEQLANLAWIGYGMYVGYFILGNRALRQVKRPIEMGKAGVK